MWTANIIFNGLRLIKMQSYYETRFVEEWNEKGLLKFTKLAGNLIYNMFDVFNSVRTVL